MRPLLGRILLLSSAALILTACDPPSATKDGQPAVGARDVAADFYSAIDGEQSGYYIPAAPVSIEGWTFHHLFMGRKADFAAWEGGSRSGVFGPVMIEFEDANSPMVQTETGESRSGRDRILPLRYRVTDSRVVFEGRSRTLGPVQFEGDLDAGRLAESMRNLGDETPVLSGTLTVRGRGYPVRMRWWAGD